MLFYADLHIHSKYSRATSKSCNLEELALWAHKKGIGVISTGDFTHPAWFKEIQEKLVPVDNGVFKLKPEIEKQIFPNGTQVRFLLSVEISTIYKKGDKTRKVHHVVFAPYMEMIVGFLNSVGINADINGRNDLTIGNKKISGNSQYVKDGRVLHHGTLLFNLNLYMAAKALEPPDCKIESKGIKSVKSRIMNIESLLKNNTTIEQFQQEMIKYFSEVYGYRVKEFTEKEKEYIDAIKKNRYDRWEWNYGYSPEYKKCRRYSIPGCGNFKVQMNIKDGIVTNISLSGDFFGNQSLQGLYSILEGCRLNKNDISVKLAEVDINNYIYNISKKDFIEMIVY